jgi:anti-sigma B factor antagonist
LNPGSSWFLVPATESLEPHAQNPEFSTQNGETVRKELAMQIAERDTGAVTVLDLSGKITLGEGDTLLKDKLHSLLHQGKKDVLLNLGEVQYVDSAGLGALVSAYTTMTREGGNLKLMHLTKKLQDLLSITKLLTVFETFDSEGEALRSFTRS